jgi:hypothetical protein
MKKIITLKNIPLLTLKNIPLHVLLGFVFRTLKTEGK